jgi:adenylate kinase
MAAVFKNLGTTNLCLVGPPGSGKGSYGRLLAKSLGCKLITASDVLRQKVEHVDMASGGLVDDRVVSDALLEFLTDGSNKDQKYHFPYILDGFPRTLKQVRLMEDTWPLHLQVHAAVSLEVPKKVCRSKLEGRRLCMKCGGNYNISDVNHGEWVLPQSLPEDCDCKQEEWVSREDDHPDVIDKRLELHYQMAMPVLDHYNKKGGASLLRFAPYKGYDDMPQFEQSVKGWLENNETEQ